MQTAVDAASIRANRALNVVMLGVTPEVAALTLPAGSRMLAADLSLPMIRGVWPAGSVGPRRWAVQGDWLALPLADASCDVAVGDGCFVLLSGPQPDALLRSIARVLRPQGTLAIRVFTAPQRREHPQDVWHQLRAGQIGNFHVFKFRLLAALRQPDGHVAVQQAWRFFDDHCDDPAALSESLGWPVEQVRTIDAYRAQPSLYWFPTIAQFRQRFAGCFDEMACFQPTYELGERCLTFTLQKRG
jgi:SAM-dependent methyltransferase